MFSLLVCEDIPLSFYLEWKDGDIESLSDIGIDLGIAIRYDVYAGQDFPPSRYSAEMM